MKRKQRPEEQIVGIPASCSLKSRWSASLILLLRIVVRLYQKSVTFRGRTSRDLIAQRGAPKMIVSDSGTGLTSNAVPAWFGNAGVE